MPTQMKGAYAEFLEKRYPTTNPNSKYRSKALFNVGHDKGWKKDRDDKDYENYATKVLSEYLP
jgi:hypothetical protein